jgi:hypothetical protein
MRGRRLGAIVIPLALALLAIVAARDVARLGSALPWNQLYDFADFYCAGAALDRGADPYRYEPLHRCEHAVNQSEAYRRDPARAVPAPLPPYDFPPFMVAARLNFSVARSIEAVAIGLAVLAAIWGLRLVAVPLDIAALALALPAGYVLLAAGQVVPFALVVLVFCGVALARERDAVAGMLAALTLIEPHLGLPVCAAVLVWLPRSRVGLLATGVALACVAVATSGFGGIVEYLARVLPAQASAETSYVYQYSLTYLLGELGMPAKSALFLGDLSYVAMLGLGVWLSRRLAMLVGRRELLAYLPAACSIIGGPYVHMVDLPVALPAALVLATSLRGRPKQIAAAALTLLAVPWIAVWITKKLFLATLVVVAAILLRLQAGAGVSLGTFFSIAAAIYLMELSPPPAFAATTAKYFAAGDLAQDAWSAYVAQLGRGEPLWFVIKLPTWAALAGVLAASFDALRACRGPSKT